MNRLSDKRTPPHFIIENAIFDYGLTPTEFMVYSTIAMHANNRTGVAFPGRRKIAQMAGVSPSTVSRTIKRLVEIGLIQKKARFIEIEGRETRRQTSNEYILLPATKPDVIDTPLVTGANPPLVTGANP